MTKTARKTPAWLLALGRVPPPETIELEGRTYRLEGVFKHDFFAFTGRYASDEAEPRRVVLKIGRRASLFGLPLSWIGRLHAWHESTVFRAVEDLEIVPRFTGRHGKHGITHEYIEGRQLKRTDQPPAEYFEALASGLAEIHHRGMAYVDLEKPQNVLLGDDGRPWLFDFQISYRWPFRRGGELFPLRWLRSSLQNSDRYHLAKLRRLCSPHTMTEEEIVASKRRSLAIRIHNKVTRPFTRMRRKVLNRIDPEKKRGGERGRVPESSQPTRVE